MISAKIIPMKGERKSTEQLLIRDCMEGPEYTMRQRASQRITFLGCVSSPNLDPLLVYVLVIHTDADDIGNHPDQRHVHALGH